jgi:hypothetical protein
MVHFSRAAILCGGTDGDQAIESIINRLRATGVPEAERKVNRHERIEGMAALL